MQGRSKERTDVAGEGYGCVVSLRYERYVCVELPEQLSSHVIQVILQKV